MGEYAYSVYEGIKCTVTTMLSLAGVLVVASGDVTRRSHWSRLYSDTLRTRAAKNSRGKETGNAKLFFGASELVLVRGR